MKRYIIAMLQGKMWQDLGTDWIWGMRDNEPKDEIKAIGLMEWARKLDSTLWPQLSIPSRFLFLWLTEQKNKKMQLGLQICDLGKILTIFLVWEKPWFYFIQWISYRCSGDQEEHPLDWDTLGIPASFFNSEISRSYSPWVKINWNWFLWAVGKGRRRAIEHGFSAQWDVLLNKKEKSNAIGHF